MDGAKLIELSEAAGFETRRYSGRAMFGRECVGVVVSHREVLRVGAALARQAAAIDRYRHESPDDVLDEILGILDGIADLMRGAREDSMGLDVIVYWPDIAWVER